jgi:inosine-uridine nucleoside N-ribohydrolase
MAVAAVVNPTLFVMRKYHVEVETAGSITRGQTVADRRDWLPNGHRERSNASICVGVDGGRFLELFVERLTGD